MEKWKDYTNIAGTPFQPYVKNQLEKRKDLIKSENRSSQDLQWLTNKNAWIRISSGVNIKDGNSYFPNEKGNILSKKYILQAGLVDHTGGATSYKLRSGIDPNGAYGIGGTDFGFKPMPGLENLSIKTGGKLGTLREATFEFTCYNMEQLNIMNTLYMRLGFSVLIEWGHTPYIDNKTGKFETNPIPLPFYGIKTKEELMEKIQKKRVEHSGNYDAMWGTVKNFSYSFEGNGEFKCKVDLVGAGDILESLKINHPGNIKSAALNEGNTNKIESYYPVISESNSSLLNELLYKIFLTNLTGRGNILEDNIKSYSDISEEYKTLLKTYYNLNDPLYTINIDNFEQSNDLVKKGFHFSLISKLNENNGGDNIEIPSIDFEKMFRRMIMGYEIDGETTTGFWGGSKQDIKESGLEQMYITLGHLLFMIQSLGFICDKTDGKSSPYNYIDINPETNRCYTFKGQCSLDPTICLIGSETLPFNIKSNPFKVLQQRFPFYDDKNPELGGRFMYTLVNLNFITGILKKHAINSKGSDVIFVDFIQDILSGIAKACGDFNEFRIVPDDDTRCVRIFDDRITQLSNKNVQINSYIILPILGKNSIVYNFNYTSKISPNMASQIVISAQAQDGGVKTNKDALSFSHLNEGLINRLSPTRINPTEELNTNNSENVDDDSEDRFIELRDFIKDLYNGKGGTQTQTEIEKEEEARRQNELNRFKRDAGGV
jgi:hypothetical protein